MDHYNSSLYVLIHEYLTGKMSKLNTSKLNNKYFPLQKKIKIVNQLYHVITAVIAHFLKV